MINIVFSLYILSFVIMCNEMLWKGEFKWS